MFGGGLLDGGEVEEGAMGVGGSDVGFELVAVGFVLKLSAVHFEGALHQVLVLGDFVALQQLRLLR